MGRPFGPGEPIQPDPKTEDQQAGARQFQYPVAVNTARQPRRDFPGLTPFEQLRNLASLYDVAALCIATRIEEMQGLDWAIVPRDKRRQNELQGECDAVASFFQRPDQLNDWPAWLGMLLYDLFSIDALTLYRRPDLTGRLYSLDPVDGATIKPLLDERGRALAYQQVLYGFPMSQYKRPEADAPDEQMPIYAPNELLYKPRWTRTFTPYGFPPTEWVILRVNTAIRKQTFDLRYFTDGNMPEGFVSPPDGMMDPGQVAQFEEAFNAVIQGDDAARRRIKFLPWSANFKELRPFSYDTVLDKFMLAITCAAYSVTPSELGFLEDTNRATADHQENVNERRGLRPLCRWLKRSIFDAVIQEFERPTSSTSSRSLANRPTLPVRSPFGTLEFQWQFGESEDRLMLAQTDRHYFDMGVVGADELRAMRFGSELDGPSPATRSLDKHAPNPEKEPDPAVEVNSVESTPAEVTKADAKGDGIDWTERRRRETAAQRLFRLVYAAQMERIRSILQERPEEGDLAAWEEQLAAAWEAEPGLFTQGILPLYDETLLAGATEGADRLGLGIDWDLVNEAVLTLAQERASAFAQTTTTASQAQTAKVIEGWIEQGGTMDDLVKRVERVWTGPRPDVAAVTEVTRLYAEGNRAAWSASGAVAAWQWHTAADQRVCPLCGPRHKKEFSMDATAELPPAHARCRCWIVPIVKKPSEFKKPSEL